MEINDRNINSSTNQDIFDSKANASFGTASRMATGAVYNMKRDDPSYSNQARMSLDEGVNSLTEG